MIEDISLENNIFECVQVAYYKLQSVVSHIKITRRTFKEFSKIKKIRVPDNFPVKPEDSIRREIERLEKCKESVDVALKSISEYSQIKLKLK